MQAYKLFYRTKDGLLFPPMVPNDSRLPTPVGVWIKAYAPEPIDKAEVDAKYNDVPEWLRRYHVECGGRGTHTGKGRLAYRPGWHLCDTMDAPQFRRKDGSWPEELVWAEVEYDLGISYQEECDERMWYGADGRRFERAHHALGGLNHLPLGGSYRYRTNPNPDSPEWIICDRIKVIRICNQQLSEEELLAIALDNARSQDYVDGFIDCYHRFIKQ